MLPAYFPDDQDNNLVRGRHGLILFNRNDTVVGLSVLEYGEYFESEVDVFSRMIRPGARVADLGANIGTHTLALARIVTDAGWVHAFEPQRLVYQTLCANVALNSLTNVDCENIAVADVTGPILVEEQDPTQSTNFGALELGSGETTRAVRGITLDEYLNGRRLDFIKTDVQGMEEACLKGARATLERFRPVLYLENDHVEKSPSLLALLRDRDYRAFWHLAPFYNPNNFANNPTNIHAVGYFETGGSHLMCNGFAINMLCVPKNAGVAVNGLLEITDIHEHPLHRGANRFHPALEA